MSLVLAHGAEGLAGDGVPGGVLYALVAAGVAIGALGLRARGTRPLAGPHVPPLTVDGAESSPWPIDAAGPVGRAVGRVLGVSTLVMALAVGWFGSDLGGLSPLPSFVLLVWWVVPLLSALLGDWWRMVDPFDAMAVVLDRRRPAATPAGAVDPVDDVVEDADDWWVPAVLLLTLGWTITCWLDRGLEPRSLAIWLTGLTAVMAVGAVVGGRAWVRRSSPYAVLCGTVAAASPLDWSGGRPRLRSPFAGLAARAGGRRSAAVVIVVLGTAFWEAVSGATWWADVIGDSGTGAGATAVLWSTAGLAGCLLLTWVAWIGMGEAAEAVARRQGAGALDEPFAIDAVAALAPLAVAAVAAHQLSELLIRGQDLLFFFGPDPFAQGWDPFGTKAWRPSEELLGAAGQAWTRFVLVALALGLLLAGTWDRLAARVGRAVASAGWVVAAWTGAVGWLALWLLLDA